MGAWAGQSCSLLARLLAWQRLFIFSFSPHDATRLALRYGALACRVAHWTPARVQHQRKPSERHRPSSFDTGVFILQNDAAHVRTSAASLARILSQLRDDMGKAQGGLRDIAAYEARVRKTDEISKAVGEGVDKAKKRRRREGGAGGQG